MLCDFARIVIEKQPRSEEEFRPILDELAGQLVNLHSSELPFSFLLSPLFQPLTFRIPNCEGTRQRRNGKSHGYLLLKNQDLTYRDFAPSCWAVPSL